MAKVIVKIIEGSMSVKWPDTVNATSVNDVRRALWLVSRPGAVPSDEGDVVTLVVLLPYLQCQTISGNTILVTGDVMPVTVLVCNAVVEYYWRDRYSNLAQ